MNKHTDTAKIYRRGVRFFLVQVRFCRNRRYIFISPNLFIVFSLDFRTKLIYNIFVSIILFFWR